MNKIKTESPFLKLNAYIAHGGVASRRKAIEMIMEGQITVNGSCVYEPSYRVLPGDIVRYGDMIIQTESHQYIVMNKPRDYVTTTDDERGRRTVISLLEGAVSERVYPVGRLDRDTTGLLVLTNDGALAHMLMHPRHGVQKTYQVELMQPLEIADLNRIRAGIELIDGLVPVERAVIIPGSRGLDVVIVLSSGRNRVIRRLFEHLGHEIRSLHRVQYAQLTTKGLRIGQWRFLTNSEVIDLRASAHESIGDSVDISI